MIILTKTIEAYIREPNHEEFVEDRKIKEQFLSSRNEKVMIIEEYIEMSECLAEYILSKDSILSEKDRNILLARFPEISSNLNESPIDIWETKLGNKFSLRRIMNLYETYLKDKEYNFDIKIDNKLYPIHVFLTYNKATKYNSAYISVIYRLSIDSTLIEVKDIKFGLETIIFLREICKSGKLTFKDFFSNYNIYPQTTDVEAYKQKLNQVEAMNLYTPGKQYISRGLGIVNIFRRRKMDMYDLIQNLVDIKHHKIILDRNLENEDFKDSLEYYGNRNKQLDDSATMLPYVRFFSLQLKKYCYVHIDEFEEYQYDKYSMDKLLLSEDRKELIRNLFTSKRKFTSSKFIGGKGEGVIILAQGSPGTGKTSTAEIYAEQNEQPLYIVSIEELGITPIDIETHLQKILLRAQTWNAVLLMDEADVFLARRGEDLNKCAIVGTFLRLLEYYKGVMFLTTNKIDVIDEAIVSRITLVLQYPNLDKDARKKLWQKNFENTNIMIESYDKLSDLELSGRDIFTYAKLCSYVFDESVNEEGIIGLVTRFPKKAIFS